MEELIFFAVIILFSILESVARSRKKRSGGLPEVPQEWEPEEVEAEWRPSQRTRETSTVTYDADPSYDDLAAEEAERTESRSSETMIPSEIWEEITGLAEGVKRRTEELERAPSPQPSTPPSTLPGRLGWGRREPRVGQQHRVHAVHAEYGTDPSSRTPSAHDGLDPLARRLSGDVRAVRQQLRQGRHALRQAVILQEVLGPPASMQPEPWPE